MKEKSIYLADKGAHFYKCDFQVHSPRDLNWSGSRPTDDAGRLSYAESLIAACREKGLDAIAVTDHHDIAFFPYIKKAASEETDETGEPIPREQRLVVFPGMELTLGVPCQALIIFDAEFPVELLPQIVTLLGVTQTLSTDQCHGQITRLSQYETIEKLNEELSRHSFLKDKFIILPNVGEGGNFTILRSGFAPKYRNLPCVGGYVDGAISKLGTGNLQILSGKNREYGNKKLSVFQTSDNRADNHQVLGTHSTWIKWATPTAEALRQACLAQESRISQIEPKYPVYQIQALHVSNSRFMGPIDIKFNLQFNALIGGRGTGKSSILEYIRWALCDVPLTDPDESSGISLEIKRQRLIENTLKSVDGEVRVGFSLNGVQHVLRRHSSTGELQIKVEASSFEDITPGQVRQLFPIHAYSQKQLSGVGVKQSELSRFLLTSVEADLAKSNELLEQNALGIKANYQQLRRQKLLEQTTKDTEAQIKSLTSQIQKLKENLSGLSEEDKKIINQNEKILSEQTLIRSYTQALDQISNTAEILQNNLLQVTSTVKSPALESPNIIKLKGIQEKYTDIIEKISDAASIITNELSSESPSRVALQQLIEQWTGDVSSHKALYEEAKQKYSTQETAIREISNLEDQVKKKNEELTETKTALNKLSQARTDDTKLRSERSELNSSRISLIKTQCDNLNELSEGTLKASLKVHFDADTAVEQLKLAAAGSKIRGRQFENLFTQIEESPEAESLWRDTLLDLESLTSVSATATEILPECPTLAKLGFPSKELPKLAQYLSVDNWLALSLLQFKEEVTFSYRVREGEYIQFSQASAGQQATVLLGVLLNQAGAPLVIDQPEDDLDNQVIQEIVEKVWNAKIKRQLIFTSHNANLVVNGDAELVICCEYRVAGDHSGGTIQTMGAIDLPSVCSAITAIMEGGKEAFNLRRQKYGF